MLFKRFSIDRESNVRFFWTGGSCGSVWVSSERIGEDDRESDELKDWGEEGKFWFESFELDDFFEEEEAGGEVVVVVVVVVVVEGEVEVEDAVCLRECLLRLLSVVKVFPHPWVTQI